MRKLFVVLLALAAYVAIVRLGLQSLPSETKIPLLIAFSVFPVSALARIRGLF